MSQLNAANQRTKRTDADNSYWDYAYDSLGQVTNAVRRWADGTLVAGQQYGYQFDDIGNRQRSEVSGQRSDYTANLLNQYTQRTVPGSVNLLGSAATNATVTVNGATATRQGEYFHSELALANTNAAAYSPIAITANMTSGTNNVTVTNTGTAFLPKTPEQFQHDADGNLISDGRWAYTWDGENRLIGMETLPNLSTNVPVQKLMFQYDAQSRRISKVVSNFNGSTWTEISNLKFVYDQWNLLNELSVVSNQFSVVRSYAWGLDLSGSPTGAGGIAGLLFGTFNGSSSTSSVAYAFDGNGNVSALLDMRTGQLAAEYEYSPFGETIRATGALAKENPFRFSTKRTDDTTGLIFYEYRILRADIGRWLSRDPIGEKAGDNIYTFVVNTPVSRTDFVGLAFSSLGTLTTTHGVKINIPGPVEYVGMSQWALGDRTAGITDLRVSISVRSVNVNGCCCSIDKDTATVFYGITVYYAADPNHPAYKVATLPQILDHENVHVWAGEALACRGGEAAVLYLSKHCLVSRYWTTTKCKSAQEKEARAAAELLETKMAKVLGDKAHEYIGAYVQNYNPSGIVPYQAWANQWLEATFAGDDGRRYW